MVIIMLILLDIIIFIMAIILLVLGLKTSKNKYWFPLFSSLVSSLIINITYLIHAESLPNLDVITYVNITGIFFLVFCLFLIITTILKCIEYYRIRRNHEPIDNLSLKQIILYTVVPFIILFIIGLLIIFFSRPY